LSGHRRGSRQNDEDAATAEKLVIHDVCDSRDERTEQRNGGATSREGRRRLRSKNRAVCRYRRQKCRREKYFFRGGKRTADATLFLCQKTSTD
jgi:hypothetical protein